MAKAIAAIKLVSWNFWETEMKKKLILAGVVALGLAACTDSAQSNLSNSLERAGDSIGNVADDAGDSIENGLDRTGQVLENTAKDVGNRAESVGNAIENATR